MNARTLIASIASLHATPRRDTGDARGWLHAIGSTRLTVVGFVLLAAVVAGTHLDAHALPDWSVVAPLALLSLNLAVSLALHPALRRGGLGVFHVALLGCLMLAAYGRLATFDGRVEVVEGGQFDAAAVQTLDQGPLHRSGLGAIAFSQGRFSVRYGARMKRGRTESWVAPSGAAALDWQVVGDDRPLVIDGYRFYTTHNKGFAPVLQWRGAASPRARVEGALHLPSYPLNDWQQQQSWTAPGGTELRVWLRVRDLADEQRPWTLEPSKADAVLVVEGEGRRFELRAGDEAAFASGTLRFVRLGGWMGYRIYRDPSLVPLFVLAVIGVLGLGWHLWRTPPRRLRDASAGKTTTGGFER